MARGGAIALAIIGGAQVRSALEHLAGDADGGLVRVVTLPAKAAFRIPDGAAGWFSALRARPGLRPPVLRPFPDIADHVEEAEAVGREMADRRRAVPARSEEHTSELQSLLRISYAVF